MIGLDMIQTVLLVLKILNLNRSMHFDRLP